MPMKKSHQVMKETTAAKGHKSKLQYKNAT